MLILYVVNYCTWEETGSKRQVLVTQKLASGHQMCCQNESETHSEIIQD